jgi:hypothetical protein
VSRFDLQTLELATRSEPVTSLYHDSVIDPVSKTVWISTSDDVVRLDISARSGDRTSPVGSSPQDTAQSCDPDDGAIWRTKTVPWLTSVLARVGSPEGLPLDTEDINDTGTALQIGGDRDEVVLYVHAGAPDLEHDPRPSMLRTGSIGDYALYSSGEGTVRQYGAFASHTWLSLSAYASTPASAATWERGTDVHGWFQRMIAEIVVHPLPSC